MIIYLVVTLQAAQDDNPTGVHPNSSLYCWRWSGCSDQEVCTCNLGMTWPSADSYLNISLSLWTPGHSIRQITIDFEGPIDKLTNNPTNHPDNKLGNQQTYILTIK